LPLCAGQDRVSEDTEAWDTLGLTDHVRPRPSSVRPLPRANQSELSEPKGEKGAEQKPSHGQDLCWEEINLSPRHQASLAGSGPALGWGDELRGQRGGQGLK
jgi:hypothetical protein